MPQDKRKSISCRSFITCDDPNGIESGAIIKSKINAQKREQDINNVKAYRIEENINHSNSMAQSVINEKREHNEMLIREITREIDTTPVTFQLLEVSKEVEKLNHVIKSWSNGNKFKEGNENSKVAKDLLKGALDLQESLVMLGKLQEGSSFMLGLPKRQNQKLKEGTFDGMVSEVRGYESSPIDLNERCGRKSVDEMRNVVRDSLVRKNVMITNPVCEGLFYDHNKMVSPDMLPSTSSSQSSMAYSRNFVLSDSSVSSSTLSQGIKREDSDLLVELMGLEPFPSSPKRQAEKERILSLAKPTYDNDSPRAKKPQFGAQEMGMKQRSVEKRLENLEFKGLRRNKLVNGLTMNSQESEVFSPKSSWADEKMSIVVGKPISYPCFDINWPYMPKFCGDNVMVKTHIGPAQKTVRNEALNFSEKYEVPKQPESEEKPKSNKKATSSMVKASVNLQPKPHMKQAEVNKASEVEILQKVTSTRMKVEEKNDAKSSDHLNSRNQEICTTLNTRRGKDGKSISKNQTTYQQKMGSPTMLDHRKQGTSELKKNRQLALVAEQKRISEGDKKESEIIYKEDNYLRGFGDSVFPTVNSIIADNDKEWCQILITDYDLDRQTKLLDGSTSEEIPYLPSDRSSLYNNNQSSYSRITSVSTSEYCGIDQLGETESPLCDVNLFTTHENGIAVRHDTNWEGNESLEKSIYSASKKDDDTLLQCVSPRTKLKTLIINNTLCVKHIEEIFNIPVNSDIAPCVIEDGDRDLESPKLLIDCAKEALKLKSSRFLQACLPLPLTYTRNSLMYPSLDYLLEEVCNGIEDLRCYSRQIRDSSPSDNLYVLLDRDFRLKSEIWGVGWRCLYTQDEVEQVISEVDRLVLNKLIEEALLDFL